jgi:hypothetical protein
MSAKPMRSFVICKDCVKDPVKLGSALKKKLEGG